ncbi:universal stress protein [Amnibacterium kyonggiense]|uniref:Universal stress protein family protein n=1 Tax=Amnibacterium kyonggiense TaxID=595671 RepID=A0A4R7FKG6_9MICO|nr:universal stress protein [Amnibacterium kyonggiense]TDS76837.1 universal stress protein family protein [Amnibacterium kyonggiense]
MTEEVLVGWDGSAAATRAAAWAAARLPGRGRLHLLRVHPAAGGEDEVRAALDELIAALGSVHPGLAIAGRIERGDPLRVLADASAPGTELVVGTRVRPEHPATARRELAVRLAAAARGTVVVVPDVQPAEPGDRVVVGVDGVASVDVALAAAREATRLRQPLLVVHAWWERIGWDALLPFRADVIDRLATEHRAVLDEEADAVVRRFPSLEVTRVAVHAPAVDALADASRYASLVVLGRHTGAVAVPALLGTTALGVLRRRTRPTMIVGAPVVPPAAPERADRADAVV